MTARYVSVDFAGSRREARDFIDGTGLKVNRRELGEGGAIIGLACQTDADEASVREQLYHLGYEDEFISVRYYAARRGAG